MITTRAEIVPRKVFRTCLRILNTPSGFSSYDAPVDGECTGIPYRFVNGNMKMPHISLAS
ncbi:MAG: hypothetical protein MJA30_06230 [Cytophagales bacterium]|nr:hypothetical protein [Cytophagales bacterium]